MEEFVRDFFTDYGLWALFVLMLLDNIGVPFPSEIPLLLAGFYVSDDRMSLIPAAVVSAAGSLAGALILYWLGRSLGRAVVLRWGKVARIGHADLDRAEAWFHRRGEPAVLYLRVIPLARTIISIPAGMLEMPLVKFVGFTFAGSLAWCFIVIGVGAGLGANYEKVLDQFSLAQVAAASTIVMVVVAVVVKKWLSARQERAEGPPA